MKRAAGIALVLAATAMAQTAPAAAATATVNAGDRIQTGTGICSLAYTYRGRSDGHTYAITAAHCQQDTTSRVIDSDAGAAGVFVRSAEDPAGRGGTDFALVDFGPATAPGTYVGNHPLVYGIDRPQIGETVCRSGATTGEHCGTVRSRRGVMQYLTEPGMTPCAGGDSGGAVWINRNGGAQIIGVWLGGVTNPDGADLGRFAVLADGFEALGLV